MAKQPTVSEIANIHLRDSIYRIDCQASLPQDPNATNATNLSQNENGLFLASPQTTLRIDLLSLRTGNRWLAEYDADYLEVITKKTGHFKKFPIFLEMLLSSVKQTNKSLTLDLLTQEDLIALKHHNRPFGVQNPAKINLAEEDASIGSKRYLILTQISPTGKIHYPLPLAFQSKTRDSGPQGSESQRVGVKDPPPQHGQSWNDVTSVARNLKNQLTNAQGERKSHVAEISRLTQENLRATEQLKQLTALHATTIESLNQNIAKLRQENATLFREKSAADDAFVRLHSEAEKEIRSVQKEFDELCSEITTLKSDAEKAEAAGSKGGIKEVSVAKSQEQIAKLQKIVQSLIHEIHKLKSEEERTSTQDRKRIEILQTENEIRRLTEVKLRAKIESLVANRTRDRPINVGVRRPLPSERPASARSAYGPGVEDRRRQRPTSAKTSSGLERPASAGNSYNQIKSRPIRSSVVTSKPLCRGSPVRFVSRIRPYVSPYSQEAISPVRYGTSSASRRPQSAVSRSHSPSTRPIPKFDPTEYVPPEMRSARKTDSMSEGTSFPHLTRYVRRRQQSLNERRARSLSAGRTFKAGAVARMSTADTQVRGGSMDTANRKYAPLASPHPKNRLRSAGDTSLKRSERAVSVDRYGHGRNAREHFQPFSRDAKDESPARAPSRLRGKLTETSRKTTEVDLQNSPLRRSHPPPARRQSQQQRRLSRENPPHDDRPAFDTSPVISQPKGSKSAQGFTYTTRSPADDRSDVTSIFYSRPPRADSNMNTIESNQPLSRRQHAPKQVASFATANIQQLHPQQRRRIPPQADGKRHINRSRPSSSYSIAGDQYRDRNREPPDFEEANFTSTSAGAPEDIEARIEALQNYLSAQTAG